MTATDDQVSNEFAIPNPEDVGTSYDQYADFYNLVASDISFHIGTWSEPGRRDALSSVFELSNKAQERTVAHVIDSLELRSNEHLLDIGCGAGAPAIEIAKHSGGRVTGINVSQGQLADANDRAKIEGVSDRVTFQYGNAMELAFENETFDAALAIDVHPHLSDRQKGFDEAFRVLKPGGLYLMSEFTVRGTPPEDQLTAYLETFSAMPPITATKSMELASAAGFELVKAERLTKDVALSTEVIYFLYADRRDKIVELYGEEVVAGLDYVMPLVRSYMRDHLGYYYFLLQKPE